MGKWCTLGLIRLRERGPRRMNEDRWWTKGKKPMKKKKPFLLCVFYEFDSVCAVDKIGLYVYQKYGEQKKKKTPYSSLAREQSGKKEREKEP